MPVELVHPHPRCWPMSWVHPTALKNCVYKIRERGVTYIPEDTLSSWQTAFIFIKANTYLCFLMVKFLLCPHQTRAINRSLFVLHPLGNSCRHKLGERETPLNLPCLLAGSPQVGSRANKQTGLFALPLKSQFLPPNVYTFHHPKNPRTQIDGIFISVWTCAHNVLG